MSTLKQAKRWVKVKEFQGNPSQEHVQLQVESLKNLEEGEALFEAEYLTVDPYMRLFSLAINSTMFGQQVAVVTKSCNKKYPVGKRFLCSFGWRSHTITNGEKHTIKSIDELGSLCPSHALGAVGMPGATAYIGLVILGELKEGNTVLVNGAAGAVGHLVGQIAKIKGCKVVGSAGTDEKCEWLRKLGFDYVFNYKTTSDLSATLKVASPDGFDIYYDNVGNDFTTTVIQNHMKKFGRVIIVGSISSYNDKDGPTRQGPNPYLSILTNDLQVKGFIVTSRPDVEWKESHQAIMEYMNSGKLEARESITHGFENMYDAFQGLFSGANTGKAIVKC